MFGTNPPEHPETPLFAALLKSSNRLPLICLTILLQHTSQVAVINKGWQSKSQFFAGYSTPVHDHA
jgi:hypothetical protein